MGSEKVDTRLCQRGCQLMIAVMARWKTSLYSCTTTRSMYSKILRDVMEQRVTKLREEESEIRSDGKAENLSFTLSITLYTQCRRLPSKVLNLLGKTNQCNNQHSSEAEGTITLATVLQPVGRLP